MRVIGKLSKKYLPESRDFPNRPWQTFDFLRGSSHSKKIEILLLRTFGIIQGVWFKSIYHFCGIPILQRTERLISGERASQKIGLYVRIHRFTIAKSRFCLIIKTLCMDRTFISLEIHVYERF